MTQVVELMFCDFSCIVDLVLRALGAGRSGQEGLARVRAGLDRVRVQREAPAAGGVQLHGAGVPHGAGTMNTGSTWLLAHIAVATHAVSSAFTERQCGFKPLS